MACGYALASGVILQTARMVPGLPDVRGFALRLVEQTVSRVQLFQEAGAIAGRLLFAFLVIRIATQRRLLRVFQVPGLIVFSCLYFFAATHSLRRNSGLHRVVKFSALCLEPSFLAPRRLLRAPKHDYLLASFCCLQRRGVPSAGAP